MLSVTRAHSKFCPEESVHPPSPCAVSRVIPGLRQLLPVYPCIQQTDGSLAKLREDLLPQPPQPPPPPLPTDALAAGAYQLYVLMNNSLPTLTRLIDDGGEHLCAEHCCCCSCSVLSQAVNNCALLCSRPVAGGNCLPCRQRLRLYDICVLSAADQQSA